MKMSNLNSLIYLSFYTLAFINVFPSCFGSLFLDEADISQTSVSPSLSLAPSLSIEPTTSHPSLSPTTSLPSNVPTGDFSALFVCWVTKPFGTFFDQLGFSDIFVPDDDASTDDYDADAASRDLA